MDSNGSTRLIDGMPRCCRCGATLAPSDTGRHCRDCLIATGLPLGSENEGCYDDYEILEVIGRGGMGVVYRAHQVSMNRVVALKELTDGAAALPWVRARIRGEAEMAGRLRHANIVTVYSVGECNDRPFFSMEYVQGASLSKHIRSSGYRPPGHGALPRKQQEQSIARFVARTARAIHYAHQCGVLHRDIKPANILVGSDGEPHVTDFGIAKIIGSPASLQTLNGLVIGTPAYMAPEIAAGNGSKAGEASDVYSLGVVIYEMLVGRPPLLGETPVETMRKVVEEEPPNPSKFCRAVNRDLATIALKCLRKNPEDRYRSALALAEDLERWERSEPIKARPVGVHEVVWRWCRRNPALAALLASVLLLLSAVAMLLFSLWQQERQQIVEYKAVLLQRLADSMKDPIKPLELSLASGQQFLGDERAVMIGMVLGPLEDSQPPRVYDRVEPLFRYVLIQSRKLGRTLALGFQFQWSHAEALKTISADSEIILRTDVAVWALARREKPAITPLLEQTYLGETSGVEMAIVVMDRSSITNLAGLKGCRFAFGLAGTAAGEYMPKALIVGAGLQAADLVVTNVHSPVPALVRGSVDAAVISAHELSLHTNQFGFRVLARFTAPGAVWVAGAGVSKPTQKTLRDCLLSLSNLDVLASLETRLSGFKPFDPEHGQRMDEVLKAAALFDQAGQPNIQ